MQLSYLATKFKNFLINRTTYFFDRLIIHNDTHSYPTFLSIEVASHCNLKCPECPVGLGRINREELLFNFQDYTKLLKEVGPYLQTLIFYFQGEPLLNKQLEEFVTLAKSYNIFTQTSTNAQLLTFERAEQIVQSGLHKLIISMDGATQSTYEKYRIGGDINKCYQGIENIQKAKEKYHSKFPIIEAQMLVFKYNENELDIFKKKVREKGANKITFKSAQIYNYQSKEYLIPTQKKYARYHQKNGEWQLKYKHHNCCLRQWSGAVITSDGNVIPCCYDKDIKYILGNIHKNSFQSIWCSTKAQKFRKLIRLHQNKIDMCQNCIP